MPGEMSESLTEAIRRRFKEAAKVCPTCGSLSLSGRDLAKKVGIAPSAAWRFLTDKAISTDNLDKIAAYLDRRGKARR